MTVLKCLILVLGINVCIFNEVAYLTVTAEEVESSRSENTPTLPPQEYEECGKNQTPQLLKENSYAVNIEEHPWLVAIYIKRPTSSRFMCGGTLISRKHVLTAAHCVTGRSPHKFMVVLGRTDIQNLFSPGVINKVNRIEPHQDYIANQADADLAILLLNKEVIFSERIRAACIWSTETSIVSIVGRRGYVVGSIRVSQKSISSCSFSRRLSKI